MNRHGDQTPEAVDGLRKQIKREARWNRWQRRWQRVELPKLNANRREGGSSR